MTIRWCTIISECVSSNSPKVWIQPQPARSAGFFFGIEYTDEARLRTAKLDAAMWKGNYHDFSPIVRPLFLHLHLSSRCEETGQALLIVRCLPRWSGDLAEVRRLGLTLAYSLDTPYPCRPHYRGAAPEAGSGKQNCRAGVRWAAMHRRRHRRRQTVSALVNRLSPLHTPGHTAGHFSYLSGQGIYRRRTAHRGLRPYGFPEWRCRGSIQKCSRKAVRFAG